MTDWLGTIMGNGLWARGLVAAIIVATFFALSRATRAVLRSLGRRISARTETVLDDRILEVVLAHVRPLMIVIGFHVGLREVRKGVPVSDLTANQILDYGDSILYIVVVILVIRILLTIIREIIDWYLDKVSAEGAADLKRTLRPLITKVLDLLVGMVAVIIVLDHFGINIGSLIVSLGVGSLAVALAAQDTIANMIAGFVILVDRPFRVGDRIELATGEVGDVEAIGLRSTRLLNYDANLIIIPNSDLVKGRITNYAYPHNQTRVMLKMGVAHRTEPEKVRRVMLDLASKHPEILKDPPPEVQLTTINESSIEFTLVARSMNYAMRGATEASLREQAYVALIKMGVEIPFPQRVVHMKARK